MELKLDSLIHNKTLVFTVTSDGYKYYTWNLYSFIKKLNVSWKLCILCLDRESFDFFNRIAGIPSRIYLMSGSHFEHKTPAVFGSSSFKRMNRMKVKALQDLSQREDIETLLFIDSDIVIFKDPIPYLKERLAEAPIWFQCDEKGEDKFVCSSQDSCTNPCSGVIAMRLDSETRPIFQKIYGHQENSWKNAVGDQDYILGQMIENKVSYKTLDRALFPNGIFINKDKFKEGDPYLLHFNYYMGTDKRRVMKQKDCWLLQV